MFCLVELQASSNASSMDTNQVITEFSAKFHNDCSIVPGVWLHLPVQISPIGPIYCMITTHSVRDMFTR